MNEKPIHSLLNLMHKGLITTPKIEWWLLKYYSLYKNLLDFAKNKKLNDSKNNVQRLPCTVKATKDEIFIDVYETLDEYSKIHKLEGYFKMEVDSYQNIKDSKEGIINWVKKNEKLGADQLSTFLMNLVDIDDNEKRIHVCWISNIEIYVERKELKYLIQFSNIFYDLFWEEQVYPDSEILKKLNKMANDIPWDTSRNE